MSAEEKVLSPQVQWAQRKQLIILRVMVKPVENPDFTIRKDYMTFKGQAIGMSGKATYGFELIFYEPVQSDKCRVRFLANEIEFRLLKQQDGVWPRLQSSHEKPHWISLDFNHFEYQHDGSDEEGGEEEEGKEMDPEMRRKVEETKAQLQDLENEIAVQTKRYDNAVTLLTKLKTGYLLIYNGIQWSGFILIVVALLKALRGGESKDRIPWGLTKAKKKFIAEGISSVYENTSAMIMFCHVLMLLEILHSALGLVRSGVMSTLLQVFGRFLIVFAVLAPAVEIHTHPVVLVLFLAWSLIELVRYPFYALSVLELEVNYLTWLRYSAWIPLYPLGFTCEALTIWLSLEHFDNNSDEHYTLPNALNMSFYPPYVLRVALCLVPLIAYNQITYMFKQRKSKLQKLKVL